MTTNTAIKHSDSCPAQSLIRLLAGRFKPEIVRLALEGPVRFNSLLKQIAGANKQSVATALKELHEAGVLLKVVVSRKPMHVEYTLSEKGLMLGGVFAQLEAIAALKMGTPPAE